MGAMNVTVDRVKTIRVMTGGLGFGGALCLVLLALKLTAAPQIPWLAVVAAPFVPVLIFLAVILGFLGLMFAGLMLVTVIARLVNGK